MMRPDPIAVLIRWRMALALRRRVPTLALLLGLASLGAPQARAADAGLQTIEVGGSTRWYLQRLPAPVDPKRPLPLVLVLHGGGGHAENAEAMTGFTGLARKEGFIVVYPEGSGRFRHRLLTWNAGHCCGYAMERGVDDVAFIAALLDRLQASLPIDPHRVYVTGLSNGGMMAHRLARELPGRFAATAPVIAGLFGDEPPAAQPVSVLMINGAQDRSVPAAGGAPGGRFTSAWDGHSLAPGTAQAEYWSAANDCHEPPRIDTLGWGQRWSYDCPDGRSVVRDLVSDNGHAWPGGAAGSRRADPPSRALDASSEIWAFFKAHPKMP